MRLKGLGTKKAFVLARSLLRKAGLTVVTPCTRQSCHQEITSLSSYTFPFNKHRSNGIFRQHLLLEQQQVSFYSFCSLCLLVTSLVTLAQERLNQRAESIITEYQSTTAAILAPAEEVGEGSFISFATVSYKLKCTQCISFEQCGFLLLFENTQLYSQS